MGQRRIDKEWTNPRNTRHCWWFRGGMTPPVQAYVVAWRRHSYRYSALLIFVEQTPEGEDQVVQRWVPADQLRPVRTDPNKVARYSGFAERLRPPAGER